MSAPSRPPAPSQESIATWQGIFAGGPYTALKMVEYILIANRKNPGEFIADPVRTTQGVTDSIIVAGRHSLKDMQPIWAGKTGRCTSFAVKAVTQLSAYKDRSRRQIYNFAIYDLAGHRIARCLQTGTVIDSSSTMPTGAFVLLEGQWQKFEKTEASWKFKSSESKFERAGDATGKVVCSPFFPIIKNPNPPCLPAHIKRRLTDFGLARRLPQRPSPPNKPCTCALEAWRAPSSTASRRCSGRSRPTASRCTTA